MAEFRNYPIYLFQFHFEKTQYERRRITNQLDRNLLQNRFSFRFINKFVEKLRKNAIHPLNIPLDIVGFSAR
jgi:hypothetical protein